MNPNLLFDVSTEDEAKGAAEFIARHRLRSCLLNSEVITLEIDDVTAVAAEREGEG